VVPTATHLDLLTISSYATTVACMKTVQEIGLELLLVKAAACSKRGALHQAAGIYKDILSQYRENPRACDRANAYLGEIYLTLNEIDSAKLHLNKAVDSDPMNDRYHYLLGSVYTRTSEWRSAIREFEISVKQRSNDAEYLRALGWAMWTSKDVFGLYYLQRALSFDPDNLDILEEMATAYINIHDLVKARQCLDRAIEIDPGSSITKKLMTKIQTNEEADHKHRGR
jgi:tetratricopeptide (TPR) repeat protein